MDDYEKPHVTPFGTLLGTFDGIAGYSNGSDYHFSGERNFENNIYTGIKYQCVEYARRWLISKNINLHNVPFAAHIWRVKYLETISDRMPVFLTPIDNGSRTPPVANSILIWKIAEDVPVGHIAIVSEVNLEQGYVRIAEQNVDNDYWPGNYARELKLEVVDGCYWIRDEDELHGWMIINKDYDLNDERIQKIEHPVKRNEQLPKPFDHSWADLQSPVEQKYLELWGSTLQSQEKIGYYSLEANFEDRIFFANSEMSNMGLRAVQNIVSSDESLAKLGIPQWSWYLIRKTWKRYWESDGKLLFTRLEFGFRGKNLKLLGIDGEPFDGLLETLMIHDKYARFQELGTEGERTQEIHKTLLELLKNGVRGFLHLWVDDEPKSEILALFLKQVLAEINVESKIIRGISFTRTENGKFVDEHGLEILRVWKAWTWEKVFEDFEKPRNGNDLKISDLLLNENIEVFEPIWKVVLSNKGIFPFLWEASQDHSYLLRSEWNLSEYFEKNGGVKVRVNNKVQEGNQDTFFYQETFEQERFGEYAPKIYTWPLRWSRSALMLAETNSEGVPTLPFVIFKILPDN